MLPSILETDPQQKQLGQQEQDLSAENSESSATLESSHLFTMPGNTHARALWLRGSLAIGSMGRVISDRG